MVLHIEKTSCCGCLTLRTANLVLATLLAIGSLACFIHGILNVDKILIVQGVGIIAYCLCFFAIQRENADLMIPALIWTIVSTVLTVIHAILLIVAYADLKNALLHPSFRRAQFEFEFAILESEQKKNLNRFKTYVIIFCFINVVIGVLSLYFCRTLHTLFKQLKNTPGIIRNRNAAQPTNF